ncbi:ParA family protein [Tautonia plasticadhaerens]|uniref:MinD/ParA/CobQ/CobA-like protein n=1 Tax=Tautonia plasticadhaerens TaxID=2527974 RepID=A0A518HF76_9BACT|nr:ParA family protein [Tautonia plasticadhaerens]QDV39478.1 MinD/ParA/CobQ/CobA-like protein [Tautonia plasticadhaerens]
MSVVAMINEKGGVGKTSSCMHLGGAIARRGLRVMLVDNDPQCSLTKGLLGNEAARGLDPATTLYALYDELPMDADDLIRPTEFEGLSLLAGSAAAKRFNVPEPHLLPFDEQARLREGLRPLAAGFDITIIDSCPNLQYCTWSGLLAADAAIIPTQPELYGAQGLAEVRDWLALVEQGWGRPIPVAGVLVTMHNARRAMHKTFVELLGADTPELLEAVVPESADFPEAIAALRPIHWHKPRGAAARAMDAVADEILGRLAALGLGPEVAQVEQRSTGKEAA